MKNILYVAGWGDIFGGGQISLLLLLRHLPARFVPLVLCPFEGTMAQAVRRLDIEVVIRPLRPLAWYRPLRAWWQVRQLRTLYRHRKIDLVHSNWTKPDIFLAARSAGVPVIWHRRAVDSNPLVDRLIAPRATRIAVISDAAGQRLRWLGDYERRVVKLFNGIDLKDFDSVTDCRSEFAAGDEPLVVNVGRLDPQKGHEIYLAAAKQVLQAIPSARFLIVGGEGPDLSYEHILRRRTRELGLEDRVRLTGYRQDVAEIIAGSDLLVCTGMREAFGRVLMEGMALGKAVVAFRSGGVPELVTEDCGLLVAEGDAAALAEAISDLLNDPTRRTELGRAGRRRIEEHFTIDRHVAAVEKLYHELLGEE